MSECLWDVAVYELIDGSKINAMYDRNAPCICCGEPVGAASTDGTVVCSWCCCGVNRQGERIVPGPHGPGNAHPNYLAWWREHGYYASAG